MSEPIPDLRDEVEYLRKLVDRLMDELAHEHDRAFITIPGPAPIIIERPTFVPYQPTYTTSGTGTWNPKNPDVWCYSDAATSSITNCTFSS